MMYKNPDDMTDDEQVDQFSELAKMVLQLNWDGLHHIKELVELQMAELADAVEDDDK